jgi:two-component system phosphate regulon sensor histidine kinase PhoR
LGYGRTGGGQIIGAAHAVTYPATEHSLDVQIVGPRKKLGDSGNLIETVRGAENRLKDLNYMARRALIWQLYPIYLLVIVASLLAVVGFAATSVRTFYLDQVFGDLRSRAALVHDEIASLLTEQDFSTLRERCQSLGKSSETRITVILPSGEVVADSEEPPETMGNHLSRPEIADALELGIGTSIRFSDTLNQKMMYVAIPITGATKEPNVLRVALPITRIDDALWSIILQIIYGSTIVALIAAGASWVVSRRITRPLGELRTGAERFARGDFKHQLSTAHSQEIDALAEAMNKMAQELEERIEMIVHQQHEQEAVLSSMIEGVIAVQADGKVISINETACRIFEVESDSAVGRNIRELVRNSAFLKFLDRAFESIEPVEDEIVFHLDEEQVYQAHGTVLESSADSDAGAVVVLHDVTRIRKLERMRTEFVSNVSHELKTPITSIKGFVETLIDNPPEDMEEQARFLSIINKNSKKLSALIEDLLNLSRIEQSGSEILESMELVRLKGIIEQVLDFCAPSAKERGITLCSDCIADQEVMAIIPLLQQALSNLVDNAIKYSEYGSTVRIGVVVDDSNVVISVRDAGPGIASDHFPRLFERFYRVDKARSRAIGGTGLGLAIVKHIAEIHRGRVDVASEIGVGSTFSITIPIA